jgi:hypothetical protein
MLNLNIVEILHKKFYYKVHIYHIKDIFSELHHLSDGSQVKNLKYQTNKMMYEYNLQHTNKLV